jgi:hypothetical protein
VSTQRYLCFKSLSGRSIDFYKDDELGKLADITVKYKLFSSKPDFTKKVTVGTFVDLETVSKLN